MSIPDLEIAANRVVDYLRRENAVRVDYDTVSNYKSVYEICEALDIYTGDWTKVKNHMLARGIHICYTPGRGHYLGHRGEEISNVVYKYKVARGWVKHLEATKEAIKRSSPDAQAWIERRFKDFRLEEEPVENYAERSV